jgi:hypothetical protein
MLRLSTRKVRDGDAASARKLFAPAGYNAPRFAAGVGAYPYRAAPRRWRCCGRNIAAIIRTATGSGTAGSAPSRSNGATGSQRPCGIAGEKLSWNSPRYRAGVGCATGQVRAAKILVAVLGASNYTFARFSEAWIGAHVDALNFLGGVLKALVAG